MTPSSTEPTAPPGLDDFLARLGRANPFLVNRVDRPPGDDWVDLGDIHDAEFRQILALGRQAHAENRGVGVVVLGEAGIGKSHLLYRLDRWAKDSRQARFVYLHNLQASPERLPRTVLRSVLNALGAGRKPPFSPTGLFRILNDILKKAAQPDPAVKPTWTTIRNCFARLVEELAARDPSRGVLFDRAVYDVLYRFFYAAYPARKDHRSAALALRWLAGEALDADEAALLGLRPGAASGADNQHVKQVLIALAQLAGLAGQLLLLCFDQVDNLDEEQVQALARFLHDLLDSAGNLLVVTTGVRDTMLGYVQRGVITGTSWDRIGQFDLSLGRIGRQRGRELLAARLRSFLQPYLAVPQVEEQVRQDALFPLGTEWYEARVRDLPDFRPRDLLTWAGERWQVQQAALAQLGDDWLKQWRKPPVRPSRADTAPAPETLTEALDRRVAEQLAEEKSQRLREPDALEPSQDQLQGLVYALLQQCRGDVRSGLLEVRQVDRPRSGPALPYDLLLRRTGPDGREVRTGIVFLVTAETRTVAAALRRLLEDPAPPERVFLVTDERQPPPLGTKSRERLEELEGRGSPAFRHWPLCPEEYAGLDALQAVVLLARAGDLELELSPGERRLIHDDEVIDSYRRHDRYRAQPLLRELLGQEAEPRGEEAADTEARAFILAEADLPGGITLRELAERLLRKRGNGHGPADLNRCLARVRRAADRLRGEGLVRTTPDEQRWFVQARPAPDAERTEGVLAQAKKA